MNVAQRFKSNAHLTRANSREQLQAKPRVLLTDTDRRPYAARLALVLAEAGCEVSAICSSVGHPLLKTPVVHKRFSYSPLHPLDALMRAVDSVRPDIIVPCDDRGVRHLHELYAHARQQRGESSEKLVSLIEHSLGAPESYSIVSARFELLRVAEEEGCRVPKTVLINTREDLDAQASQPFPWVLKADETWGGRGVRIAHNAEQGHAYFDEVSRPFRFGRAVKRMVVNRDPFWIRPWWESRKPAVVVQAYVHGRPANCAVWCWQGELLGEIGVEVLSADEVTGPASVVRVLNNPDMISCAERIARRLRLSGFFGLDFMIEDGTNDAYLIEMNPRCTPLCHLRLGKGRDLVGALWARLSGQAIPDAQAITENDMIAYFPQAWNSKSEFLESSFHDIPRNHPELIKEFLRPWPERSLLYRLTKQLQPSKDLATVAGEPSPSADHGDER
ncbi:MAG: ATP-grasp domain-containing protein [Terriglobales bacterium]